MGEFPGGLVVRIQGFHCCGPGSIPGQETKIPQVAAFGKKKKKKKERKERKMMKELPYQLDEEYFRT